VHLQFLLNFQSVFGKNEIKILLHFGPSSFNIFSALFYPWKFACTQVRYVTSLLENIISIAFLNSLPFSQIINFNLENIKKYMPFLNAF
jgi:hypothetical protein